MKEYDDYYCSHCQRFQMEEEAEKEVSLLPVFKLKEYLFTCQKYAYLVETTLGAKIAYGERRDISRFAVSADKHFRYYFFNNIKRIIASIDSSTVQSFTEPDAAWKVYDYGRNFRGEIKYLVESDSWHILDAQGELLGLRDPGDQHTPYKASRNFTVLDANNQERELFKIQRKARFTLKIIAEDVDPHLAWGFLVGIHRKYFV